MIVYNTLIDRKIQHAEVELGKKLNKADEEIDYKVTETLDAMKRQVDKIELKQINWCIMFVCW